MTETLKKQEDFSLDLKGEMNNRVQKKLLEERFDDTIEAQLKMIEWIKNNSSRFREEFDKLWEELKNDENYEEVFNLADQGDDHVLLEVIFKRLNEKF